MKKTSYIVLGIILILIIYAIFGSTNRSDEIRLGAVLPMTGGLASIGEDLKNGMELAAQKEDVSIKIEDGMADPKKSLSAGQALSEIDKVSVILTAFRGASLSIASSLKNKTTIVFATTATTDGKTVSTSSENFFVIGAEMISAGKIPGEYAIKNKLCSNVSLISEQSDAGKDKLSGFEQGVGKEKVVFKEFFQPSDRDFKTLISKMKEKKSDCMFVEVRSNNFPTLLDQMSKQNFFPKIFANSYSVTPQGIKDSPESETKNVIFSSTAFDTNQVSIDFAREYREKYKKEPTDFAAIGYEMIRLISKPLKECKSDIVCTKEKLASIRGVDSSVGILNMSENREIQLKEYNLYTINNKNFEKIK